MGGFGLLWGLRAEPHHPTNRCALVPPSSGRRGACGSGVGGLVGDEPLHFLLLPNGELAASLFRPSLLSPEGFPASFLEAFPPPADPGPTDFPFIGYPLLGTTFLQHLDRPTAHLFLSLRIQGPCLSFFLHWTMQHPCKNSVNYWRKNKTTSSSAGHFYHSQCGGPLLVGGLPCMAPT